MMNRPWTDDRAGAKGAGLDARLRVLRILWACFLVTIGLYVLVTVFILPPGGAARARREVADDPTLLAAFAVLAFMFVAASFVLKRHFYHHAAEQGDPARFQTGFIVAEALCEAAVILGFVSLLVTHSRYAYALFALGALGQLLHFPRRDQLAAAYWKKH